MGRIVERIGVTWSDVGAERIVRRGSSGPGVGLATTAWAFGLPAFLRAARVVVFDAGFPD